MQHEKTTMPARETAISACMASEPVWNAAIRVEKDGMGWPAWGVIHMMYMKNDTANPPAPRAARK